MIATSKQYKRINKSIEALTDLANEANLLWNDNINPDDNLLIRDLAWNAVSALKQVKKELDKNAD